MLNFELTRNQVWLPKLNFKTFRTLSIKSNSKPENQKTGKNQAQLQKNYTGSPIQIQVLLPKSNYSIVTTYTNP